MKMPGEIFEINYKAEEPVYLQIEKAIIRSVETGRLLQGDKLPSINKVCREFSLAPGTVSRAYNNLVMRSVLVSRQGKGYYIGTSELVKELNIFLLFDRLNAYKEVLYESFIRSLGEEARVDVYFHHYREDVFARLIRENLGKYSHYVIMPHFNEDVSGLVEPIPPERLMLIDKSIPNLKGKYSAVVQDFENDIYDALCAGIEKLKKYGSICLVTSSEGFQFVPDGIRKGVKRFCKEIGFDFTETHRLENSDISKGKVLLLFKDSDLIFAIREVNNRNLQAGKDVGLISFDDTPMKSVLNDGITVVSTDFRQMGETAARLLLENRKEMINNPFSLILRNTL